MNETGSRGSSEGVEPSDNDALRSLSSQLSDPCLKSSTRILILISVALNNRIGFMDLLSLTGTGKGSLSNHTEKLESSGYVKIRNMMTFSGPRVVVEITQKGMDAYGTLLTTLGKLTK